MAKLGDYEFPEIGLVESIELDWLELQAFRERFPAHLDADEFSVQP